MIAIIIKQFSAVYCIWGKQLISATPDARGQRACLLALSDSVLCFCGMKLGKSFFAFIALSHMVDSDNIFHLSKCFFRCRSLTTLQTLYPSVYRDCFYEGDCGLDLFRPHLSFEFLCHRSVLIDFFEKDRSLCHLFRRFDVLSIKPCFIRKAYAFLKARP